MSSRNTALEHGQKKRGGVNRGFKSPLISRTSSAQGGTARAQTASSCAQPSTAQSTAGCRPHSTGVDDDDEERLKRDVSRLREELEETEKQIQQLKDSGIEESELAEYINKLHEYNDLKDIGQMVIGNIANLQGVRTRDLYPKYGLELDD